MTKAKAGKALFMEHCASCHNAWPYPWTEPNKYGKRFVLVGLVPQTYVGTDRAQFETLRPVAITGQLEPISARRRSRARTDRCRPANLYGICGSGPGDGARRSSS